MTWRWTLAALHLLALGIGLGAVWVRGRLLRSELQVPDLRRALRADAWWGGAGALWIGTGLWRLLAETEKPTGYYLENHLFLGKMALLVVLLALEIGPIVVLTRWRRALAAGQLVDTGAARRLAAISFAQVVLVVLMVVAATGMARGLGVPQP